MPTPTAAELAARLDRLPSSRYVWKLVILISLGACFEFYDLFLTAYVVPGMAKEGLFTPQSLGIFGVLAPLKVAGPGTFVFALFAGLWVGTMAFGWVSDAYGRRFIFTFSLVWYCISTLIMALQTTGFGIDLWRFIAGIGIGVELVTIDTYISELIPRHARGRAFAFNQFIAFLRRAGRGIPGLCPRYRSIGAGCGDWRDRRDLRLVAAPGRAGIAALAGPPRPPRRSRNDYAPHRGKSAGRAWHAAAGGRRTTDRIGRRQLRRDLAARPMADAQSCCRSSTSSRPSATTASPPGCRRC